MTKQQLRRMLLAHLKVINAADESPPAELANLADIWIDTSRAELQERGLVWWDANDIPDAAAMPFMLWVASQAAPAFGKNGKGHEARMMEGEVRLAALKSSAERPTVRATYF